MLPAVPPILVHQRVFQMCIAMYRSPQQGTDSASLHVGSGGTRLSNALCEQVLLQSEVSPVSGPTEPMAE